MPVTTAFLNAACFCYVVFTEHLAPVATDVFVGNDLLPAQSHEPADVRRAVGGSAL